MLTRLIGSIYRRLPIKGGQTRLCFNPLLDRLMRDLRDPVKARLWDGASIEVDPKDHDGRVLYLFGTNDIKVSLNTNLFLRPGDVFLDIGANYSTIGLQASHAVGPEGAVHLFEPQTRLADRVEAAIRRGGYRNVKLHRCGLLDVDETLTIRSPSNHSGMATFASHGGANDFDFVQECQVYDIGRYVAPLVKGRRFGAKLDIEGSEMRVIPWLLAQPNLAFAIFEANQHKERLFELVKASKLTLFGLERNALELRLCRIDTADRMRDFHDVIALRLQSDATPPIRTHPKHLVRAVVDAA